MKGVFVSSGEGTTRCGGKGGERKREREFLSIY